MKSLAFILLLTLQGLLVVAQADTWVATDVLGRKILPEENGIKKDRYVGIFYFIWQGAHGYDRNDGTNSTEGVKEKKTTDTVSPYDIS
ncbi:MAG: hypothetical protein EOP49_35075, partial [Sphingobacteriales bacterium]